MHLTGIVRNIHNHEVASSSLALATRTPVNTGVLLFIGNILETFSGLLHTQMNTQKSF